MPPKRILKTTDKGDEQDSEKRTPTGTEKGDTGAKSKSGTGLMGSSDSDTDAGDSPKDLRSDPDPKGAGQQTGVRTDTPLPFLNTAQGAGANVNVGNDRAFKPITRNQGSTPNPDSGLTDVQLDTLMGRLAPLWNNTNRPNNNPRINNIIGLFCG